MKVAFSRDFRARFETFARKAVSDRNTDVRPPKPPPERKTVTKNTGVGPPRLFFTIAELNTSLYVRTDVRERKSVNSLGTLLNLHSVYGKGAGRNHVCVLRGCFSFPGVAVRLYLGCPFLGRMLMFFFRSEITRKNDFHLGD